LERALVVLNDRKVVVSRQSASGRENTIAAASVNLGGDIDAKLEHANKVETLERASRVVKAWG
jgi:hypothetical protein